MVDAIIRLTVLVVLVLGTLNAAHALRIVARVGRHLARRPDALALVFPVFRSAADVRAWLARWRRLLDSEPALVTVRRDARLVLVRHIHLTVASHTWTFALAVITTPSLV